MPGPLDCKIYVGDLGSTASKQDLEDAFGYYGPLRNVWVARNPPGFAFVEFEDSRDAEDAVRGIDGRNICGRRVRVELSTGKSRSRFRGPPQRRDGGGRGGGGRPFRPEDKCYECGERGHYARDCRGGGRKRYSRSRSRSRSPRRKRSYSRSKSRSHDRSRSRDRSRSKSRSRSYRRSRSKGRSQSRDRSKSRGHSKENQRSRSRSASHGKNGAAVDDRDDDGQ